MIETWKPIGAFLEYTIRPLLDEFKWLLEELKTRGIEINESNIRHTFNSLINAYFKIVIVKAIQYVLIAGVICFTLWKIYQ